MKVKDRCPITLTYRALTHKEYNLNITPTKKVPAAFHNL